MVASLQNQDIELRQHHVPALDGMRGIAILGVLAFHFDLSMVGPLGLAFHFRPFSLGWTGVTLFFVLSGFLITQVLLSSKHSPGYFRNFYMRRALRIFPAYYLMLGLAFGVPPDLVPEFASGQRAMLEWPYYVFYVSNYWLGMTALSTPMSPLLGLTWSLSVEEQFYLVWPLIVLALATRALTIVCVGLIIASPLLRWGLLEATGNPTLVFASLTSNLDPLAIGALLALLRADGHFDRSLARSVGRTVICVAGVALFYVIGRNGTAYFLTPTTWMSTAIHAALVPSMFAILFGGFFVLALHPESWTARLLRIRPLVALGQISYGVYLYHILVNFVITKLFWVHVFVPIPGNQPQPWMIPLLYFLRYGLIIAFAAISYRYLEMPFLKLKRHFAS